MPKQIQSNWRNYSKLKYRSLGWPSNGQQEAALTVANRVTSAIRVVVAEHIAEALLVVATAVRDDVVARSTGRLWRLSVAGAVGGVATLGYEEGLVSTIRADGEEEMLRTAASIAGLVLGVERLEDEGKCCTRRFQSSGRQQS